MQKKYCLSKFILFTNKKYKLILAKTTFNTFDVTSFQSFPQLAIFHDISSIILNMYIRHLVTCIHYVLRIYLNVTNNILLKQSKFKNRIEIIDQTKK